MPGARRQAADHGLRPSDRAPGLLLGPGAHVHDSVEIGGHVVIHADTFVAEGARVQDGVVLGKPLALGAASRASGMTPAPLRVEAGATICAGAVLLAGGRVGAGALVGDQAYVRERALIGDRSVVGRGSAVENDVTIGEDVKVQTGCYLTARTVVEDRVFVAPGVVTTNDHAMGRHAPGQELSGPLLRRACRVGGGAVLLPGIEVGEEAFVAAGAVVVGDVPSRTVVMGVPARAVREVPAEDLAERWG